MNHAIAVTLPRIFRGLKSSKERIERCQEKAVTMVNSLSQPDGVEGRGVTSPTVDDGIFPGRFITRIFENCGDDFEEVKYYLGEVYQTLHNGVQAYRNISLAIMKANSTESPAPTAAQKKLILLRKQYLMPLESSRKLVCQMVGPLRRNPRLGIQRFMIGELF